MKPRIFTTFETNESFCIATIAAQFILAGYADNDALNKAGRLLELSKEYLHDQESYEYFMKVDEEDKKVTLTIEDVQNRLKLKGPERIKHYCKKVFSAQKYDNILKNIKKGEKAFSQNDYDEIQHEKFSANENRQVKSGEARKKLARKILKNKALILEIR